MKIKSVKITGFRAFEKEENSTFDFTSNGEIMDFASIYAPNGFGKTSFYDAVEWGVTHQIQRFDRMDDFEKMRKENSLPLLLNNSSSSGKVIVETDSNTFENTINKRKVYSTKTKPENEYFRNQILSQDLIDTFIKEDRADKRYERFLEIDSDLKNYDSIYKKAVRVLDYIKQEKVRINGEIEKQKKSLQLEIDYNQEFKKFDEINELISSLKKNGETLDYVVKESFDETLHDNLSRNVRIRLLTLEEEFTKVGLQIDNIRLAKDGEENGDNKLKGGVLEYIDSRNRLENFDNQIKELNRIISLIESRDKAQRGVENTDKNLSEHRSRLEEILNIEKKIEEYLILQKVIEEQEKRIGEFKNENGVKESEKSFIEEETNLLKSKNDQLQESLKQNQIKLEQIPNQKAKLDQLSKSHQFIKKSIEDLSKSIEDKEPKLIELKKILELFGYYETKIDEDLELLAEFSHFTKHQDLIRQQLDIKIKIEISKKQLAETQSKINNQNQFNNELKEYVNRGLEIISQTHTSDCPLCNHQYNSFEELSNNIVENKFFDNQLKENLEKKISIETEINELNVKILSGIENIKKSFALLKQPFSIDYDTLRKEIGKLNLLREEKKQELKNNIESTNEILVFLGNEQTLDELTKTIQEEISKIQLGINHNTKLINTNNKKKNDLVVIINGNNDNIKRLNGNIEVQQKSEDYIIVIDYFNLVLNHNQVDKAILLKAKSEIEKIISEFITEKKKYEDSLNQLNIELSNHNLSKQEYGNRIQQVNDAKNLILRVYESYESFIKSEFKIELTDKDKSQIEKEFFDLIEKQKQTQKIIEDKIEKYKIIEILKDDCLNVTVSQKIQDKIKKNLEGLKKLDNAEGQLNIEKDNLIEYLTKTIDEFFYTELINKIYKKIDPHPDYQAIEFKCEFADAKPRLQIYTTKVNDKGDVERSVPALYFSTAQVNILSLSIFLARALKTKNPETKEAVDCIFIDDPIQSMDSINILSFIDLFRGITLSLGKQLIVSTHEENFHLLLQKKIPNELFKSKFIEFETFGKLKPDQYIV